MADEPRDLGVALADIDLIAFFEDEEAKQDWDAATYEPTHPTRAKMLIAANAYRVTHSRKAASQVAGWSYRYQDQLIKQYPPFAALMQLVTDGLAGKIRSGLVEAALIGGSVPALIHLDELLSPEDYASAKTPVLPQIQLAVTTMVVPGTVTLTAHHTQLAQEGVQNIEVPFTLPTGADESRPSWYEQEPRYTVEPDGYELEDDDDALGLDE